MCFRSFSFLPNRILTGPTTSFYGLLWLIPVRISHTRSQRLTHFSAPSFLMFLLTMSILSYNPIISSFITYVHRHFFTHEVNLTPVVSPLLDLGCLETDYLLIYLIFFCYLSLSLFFPASVCVHGCVFNKLQPVAPVAQRSLVTL